MNGPANGVDSVTGGMERVSVQPHSQFSDRRIELTQDEDDWDWVLLLPWNQLLIVTRAKRWRPSPPAHGRIYVDIFAKKSDNKG